MDNLDDFRDEARMNNLFEAVRDHDMRMKGLETIGKQVQCIHDALLGTYDKKGLVFKVEDHDVLLRTFGEKSIVTKVEEHDEYIGQQRKGKYNFWFILEKSGIAAAFGYLLYKVTGVH